MEKDRQSGLLPRQSSVRPEWSAATEKIWSGTCNMRRRCCTNLSHIYMSFFSAPTWLWPCKIDSS